MEVIILTGGKGTRLQSKINDRPKTMADVNSIPFLQYTLDYLEQFNINKVILAVGYKKEYIEQYFGNQYKNIEIIYSEEEESLGTGGAIKQAIQKCKEENIIVMNGDVYSKIDFKQMYNQHIKENPTITIAVKEMEKFDRFGVVHFENDIITKFEEKRYVEKGFMNVGIYVLNRNIFENKIEEKSFSFENDYLNKYVSIDKFKPYIYDGEFIDIGIPEDYEKIKFVLKKEDNDI